MHRAEDWVQYSLDLPFAHPPGERWAYNSSSLILVGEAVASTSGMPLEEFAERYLFDPLGIEMFRWQFSPDGRAWIGGGARMIPREMAMIGQLMLNRGLWNGERLLSEKWIDLSTTKQSDPLTGVDYGYLWQMGSTYIGRDLVTAFWASGNGGQYVIVLPDQGMVVVFTGGNYDSPLADQPFRMLTHSILPAFMRPPLLETVVLSSQEKEELTGTYRLEFEPSATTTVAIEGDQVRLRPPGGEAVVVFEADGEDEIVKQTIYGSFQRFGFVREVVVPSRGN
jgi:CubicO group peptidase (beta-lactamase class C family)